MEEQKLVHTLVIDAGPIIKNDPSVSSLIAQSHKIVTLPAIIDEIQDSVTRARLDSTLRPFLELRNPTPASIKVITDFARRTGDLAVLSRPDINLMALAYEIECERNGGDWRLRRAPGQKTLNGSPPIRAAPETAEGVVAEDGAEATRETTEDHAVEDSVAQTTESLGAVRLEEAVVMNTAESVLEGDPPSTTARAETTDTTAAEVTAAENEPQQREESAPTDESGDESDGWITPSNIKKQQEKDAASSLSQKKEPKTMQVATLTSDFAMQNVILQMNLNLLSPSLQRVRHIKTYILRCHACFEKVRDMSKQFCPRCGKPTLTRVACSTDQNGTFTLHLKKNMQWNTRGDRFSIPKAVGGSSSGKLNIGGGGRGGGKGGWGQELILAEDQKEYQRATAESKRGKARDLMDEDYLPAILSGHRAQGGGKIKVGAGRNVNARKR